MDQNEFLARMEELDTELAEKGVPIHARPFHALPSLIGSYEGSIFPTNEGDATKYSPFEGPNLLTTISEWYVHRYGDRVNMPSELAKVPIVLRRQIYLLRIPLAYGRPTIDAIKLIEGMTDGMKVSLTSVELQSIGAAFSEGYTLAYEIEDVRGSFAKFSADAADFFEAAVRDRDTGVQCLTGAHPDLNGGCFHAQQHAEKMLKGYLLAKAGRRKTDLRRIAHAVTELFDLATARNGSLLELSNDVGLIQNVRMDIRYKEAQVPVDAAVATVWAALRIGGAVACAAFDRPRRRSWAISEPRIARPESQGMK